MGLDLGISKKYGTGTEGKETEILYLRKGWSMFHYFEENFGMPDTGYTTYLCREDLEKMVEDFTAIIEDIEINNSFEKAREIYPIDFHDIQIEDYNREYYLHVKEVLERVTKGLEEFNEKYEDLYCYGSY